MIKTAEGITDDKALMEKVLFNCEIKSNKEDDTYTFYLSDETIDAHGEVVKVDGWDLRAHKKNGPVLWCHDHSIPAIGKTMKIGIIDKKLVATMRFAKPGTYPLADTIHALVDDGIIKAVSVGFVPLTREYPDDTGKGMKKKPVVITLTQRLYEWSLCNIGVNPSALRKAMETKGCNEEVIKSIMPQEEAETVEISTAALVIAMEQIKERLDTIENKVFVDKKSIYDGLLEGAVEVEQPSEKKQSNPFAKGKGSVLLEAAIKAKKASE